MIISSNLYASVVRERRTEIFIPHPLTNYYVKWSYGISEILFHSSQICWAKTDNHSLSPKWESVQYLMLTTACRRGGSVIFLTRESSGT